MAQEEVANGASAEKTVTFTAFKPLLTVEAPKAADAVQFYKSAFGAVEIRRSLNPKRKADQEFTQIISAELQLSGFTFFVSDASGDSTAVGKTEGVSIAIWLETEDVEATIVKAVAAGAVKDGESANGEAGACCGGGVQANLKDPYGFIWIISSATKKAETVEDN
ncbi:PREDICTED: uncharacterized protein At5g48480-like [Tarenaya hassleriana]|uniref:uncharacterized protein At5g48480-like n=1 Tax=Tarenaya hassleriana TaxID=28532 RepID=UPI00053C6337|nr:PREDICTED: uncharacterized protein At5g48480-like [Tarenaya hassleriana]